MSDRMPGPVRTVLSPIAKRALLAWEQLESGISYDLTSRAVMADPYFRYEQLRQRDPIHRMRLTNAWGLIDYEDARERLLAKRK